MGYHVSVSHLPTKQDIEEERECRLCPVAVQRTLGSMLDVSLLRSPSFMLLSISGFLTMMGFYVPFIYIRGNIQLVNFKFPLFNVDNFIHLNI